MMDNNQPEFIQCAMEAIEQGIKASDIQEECACRMWLQQPAFDQNAI